LETAGKAAESIYKGRPTFVQASNTFV